MSVWILGNEDTAARMPLRKQQLEGQMQVLEGADPCGQTEQ